MGKIVIAGGGMCGMAAAMMLADDGHTVTVLERDPAPPPPDPHSAFDGWERRGVGQFNLAHWLHARGTRIMRTELPRAYELLSDNGGLHFNFMEYLRGVGVPGSPEDGDDRFDLLTGRRSTLEWAMATAADEHPGVTVRRGSAIAGVTLGAEVRPGVPHVDGVRLADGDEIHGDFVVDATGRRSPTPDWLAAIGATSPLEDAEDSGFAYYGRYFQSDDGSIPALLGPLLVPYESFSILALPADNGTWALTLYGLSEDKAFRKVREPEVYERVVRSCPLHVHWLDGEPITEMISMAGVVDRHRQFVVDGEPCATGLLTVADASSCTNPSLGRGITIGLIHVEVLRSCIADHLGDPASLSLAFHDRTEAEVRPWHDATTALDRRRVADMRTYLAGGIPEPTPEEHRDDMMQAAVATDAVMARAFLDMFSCNVLPDEMLARPEIAERLALLGDSPPPEPAPGPTRSELEEMLV